MKTFKVFPNVGKQFLSLELSVSLKLGVNKIIN